MIPLQLPVFSTQFSPLHELKSNSKMSRKVINDLSSMKFCGEFQIVHGHNAMKIAYFGNITHQNVKI